jgi:hypothetical protein
VFPGVRLGLGGVPNEGEVHRAPIYGDLAPLARGMAALSAKLLTVSFLARNDLTVPVSVGQDVRSLVAVDWRRHYNAEGVASAQLPSSSTR